MSREKGTASYSANFEAEKAAPIDARMIVGTQADLFLEATWTANDGGVYVYKGMIVCVHSDATESNNGLYRLNNVDYTNSNNWIYVGSGGGPATDEKVKYNSGDPTAGYIADKIASGSGIIVAEGTSVNLNKLVITNADKGSVAISGHNSAFNHANIAHSNRTALNAVSGTNTGDQDSSDFNLANLADVDDSAKATGKILKVHSSGKHVYVDESSGNDEKVKINEDDPLAGYLQNKLVAGSGISIVEGTGDGEGTLIVTNTDKGSDVDLSGLLPDSHLTDFVHSDIAHANRSDLDLVSGTNTGDSSGHSNLLPDSHLTDFTHSDIAHANRSDLDNVSGINTGDQEIYSTFGITTDGAGNTITTGEKGRLVMTYSGELKEWSITTKEGTSGSIAYIINKNGVTMIGAGTKPNLSSQATNSATITNWTSIVVAKGDIITFIVDSVASIDWVNLSITALKT